MSIGYDAFDRPEMVTDGDGTVFNVYDGLDPLSEMMRNYTGVPLKKFVYEYFDDGSRNTMTVKNSSGATLLGPWTYGYDKNGRCTSLHSPADVSSAGLTLSYIDNGLPNRRTLPNGLYTDTTWNGLNLPLTLKNYNASSTLAGQFDTYTYDGAFNITGWSVSSHNGGLNGAVTEQYDTKDRLTQEYSTRAGTGSTYTSSFGYDGAGNPTTFKGTTQTFDSDNKRTGTGYAYDGNGSPTTYNSCIAEYDQENRLTRIDTPQGYHQLNGYTAGGLRAWKNFFQVWAQGGGEPTGTRTYFYYDGTLPAFETDASGSIKAINVFAPDGLVARGTVGQSGTSYKYYSFDSQGSVVHRSNSGGSITQSAMYDAYGKQVQVPGPNNATDAFGWNGRWGYYQDTDTGLILCTYGYYDASQGRWLTRDPVGYARRINLDGYCASEPLSNADPLDSDVGRKLAAS